MKTVDLYFDCSLKQALKKHISEIHEEGKKPFKCDICDQNSSQKGNLNVFMQPKNFPYEKLEKA